MNRNMVVLGVLCALAVVAAVVLLSSKAPRVCVLMVSTPDLVASEGAPATYVDIAAEINELYARTHGYDFLHHIEPAAGHADAVWKRVHVLRRLLRGKYPGYPGYDAVFYIDGDAAFNRHETPLDRWLHSPGDIVGCSDEPNGPSAINTGTLLVKRTRWSLDFLAKWGSLQPQYSDEFPYEQQALHDLIRGGHASRVDVRPANEFNSVFSDIADGDRSMFVLHFMASEAKYRHKELSKVLTRVKG